MGTPQLGGDDTILGIIGRDIICRGRAKDEPRGGPGTDFVNGDAGDDDIFSGPGAHGLLYGDKGEDLVQVDAGRPARQGPTMTAPRRGRVQPTEHLPSELESAIRSITGGHRPLPGLFTVLGRDPRLLKALLRGGLLDPGNLTLREREILVHRVTAACGADYEWGLHAAHFAAKAGFDHEALNVLATGDATSPPWTEAEAALIELCDALHHTATVGTDLWRRLQKHFSDEAIMEAVMVSGYYRMVSYLANVLDLPLEPGTNEIRHPRPQG